MSGFEVRECRSCFGCGEVLLDAEYDPASGELVQVLAPCPVCRGVGSVSAYLYAKPDVRRLGEAELVRIAWNGTARERVYAEKELRRRQGKADNPLLED